MVHNDHIQKINGTEETYIEPLENFTRWLMFEETNHSNLFVVFPQSHSPLLRTLRHIKQWDHQTEADTYVFWGKTNKQERDIDIS